MDAIVEKIKEYYPDLNVEQCNLDTPEWKWGNYDIIINLDLKQINQNDFKVITQLNKIIQETNDTGEFELGNIKVEIKNINDMLCNFLLKMY